MAGNARKKSPRLGHARQPIDGRRRRELAERLDRVKPHVRIRIVQRAKQRVDRSRPALSPERERGLDPQVGVRILHAAE